MIDSHPVTWHDSSKKLQRKWSDVGEEGDILKPACDPFTSSGILMTFSDDDDVWDRPGWGKFFLGINLNMDAAHLVTISYTKKTLESSVNLDRKNLPAGEIESVPVCHDDHVFKDIHPNILIN